MLALLTVASVVLSGGLLAAPEPAVAALTNVWPANAEGDIYPDNLTTTSGLYVYVTSDLTGGRVCIIAATGDGDCDSPAWGDPNVIIGIGTVFQLIEGPALVEGTFRLRTETPRPAGQDGWEEGATSDVFTIQPCRDDCDSTVGAELANEFKAANGEATELATRICDGLSTSDEQAAAESIKGGFEAIGSRSLFTQGAFIGTFALGAVGIEFASYNDTAKRILVNLSCQVARMHKDIADDPPDSEFLTVAPPVFSSLTTSGQPASDELAVAFDRQVAYGVALRVAYERFQGAQLAGDPEAQQRQLDAAGEYGFQLATAMRVTAGALRAAAASSEAAVEGVPAPTDEALAALHSMASRVSASGFIPGEIAQLQGLGASSAQIENARTWFARPFNLVVGESLDEMLPAVADGLEGIVPEVDRFARHVSAIRIPIPNRTPVAVDDSAGTAWDIPVEIDVLSNDSDADGDAIEIISSTHGAHGTVTCAATCTYTPSPGFSGIDAFDYLIQDPSGATAGARVEITVTPGPIATFSISATSGIAPMTVAFDASGSVSPAGEITTWEWDFGDGSTDVGEVVTHKFNDGGSFTIRLTVTDDAGAQNTTTRPVLYTSPDAIIAPVCGDQDDDTAVTRCSEYSFSPGVETWTVAGTGPTDVVFDWVYRNAGLGSQLSVFPVDDEEGTIDGTAPGEPSYAAKAVARAAEVFPPNSSAFTPDSTVRLTGGDRVAFYIATSSNEELAQLENPAGLLFSIARANEDGFSHALAFDRPGGPAQFSFEDLPGGGDGDFDDVIFTAAGIGTDVVGNQAPTAVAQTLTTPQGTALPITLSGTDADGDDIDFAVVTPPAHGSLTGEAPALVYTPAAGYTGSDEFAFTASDGEAKSAPAIVSITVTPVNRPPTLDPLDERTLLEGDELRLIGVASDPDGDPVTFDWEVGAGALGADPLPAACRIAKDGDDVVVGCDDDAVLRARLIVSDSPPEGEPAQAQATARVTFGNAPPAIENLTVTTRNGGSSTLTVPTFPAEPLVAAAPFTDPGVDVFTCGVEIGATSFPGIVSEGRCTTEIPALATGLHVLAAWVADDDGGVDRENLEIAVLGTRQQAGTLGVWQTDYRDKRSKRHTTAEKLALLAVVRDLSAVFSERRALSDIPDALSVLSPKNTKNPVDQFDAHLLALWLNIADAAIAPADPVDTNLDGVADSTVGAVISQGEAARTGTSPSAKTLTSFKNLFERINASG